MNKDKEIYGFVGFDELEVSCIIGNLPHEREQMQKILVSLSAEIDFFPVSLTDALSDTIDYVYLESLCNEIAQKGKYLLVETYAIALTNEILDQQKVKSVWVKIKKIKALPNAKCAIIELKRCR